MLLLGGDVRIGDGLCHPLQVMFLWVEVQLQHCLTISRDRWLGRITVENIPPVGVSPFFFRPPDGPAAVANRNTPPAIARPSLLQSEIAAGLLHQELTPLAHSRHPLVRRRPHLHRGVCVCVCVIYVYSTLNLFHYIPVVDYLRLTDPFAIPSIRRLRCLP